MLPISLLTGHIEYMHEVGEMTGTLLFKFKLSDTEGNELIDQDFFITVMGKYSVTKKIKKCIVIRFSRHSVIFCNGQDC